MGRPIKAKYFGNLNAGSASTTADDGIGGEGVTSISWSQLGSFRGNNGANNPLVGFALPAPTLPGGVQATWNPLFEVESVTTGAGKAGLNVGDTYTYAGLGSPVFTVSDVSGANALFTVTNRGEVALADLPGDTQTVSITKVAGTGAATFVVDINFRVKSANIIESGSGYVGSETFTVTLYTGGAGTAPAGTLVRTATQQNALNVTAYLLAKDGGVSAKAADIVKQEASVRYLVKTADGTGQCKLVASNSPAAGQMNIIATDVNGSTYWVTKLTARRAILTRRSMTGSYEFETNARAGWTLGSASAGVVSLGNA